MHSAVLAAPLVHGAGVLQPALLDTCRNLCNPLAGHVLANGWQI